MLFAKMSLKRRLTIYIATLFFIVTAFMEAGVIYLSDIRSLQSHKQRVRDVVLEAIDDLEYDDDELEFDDVDFYRDGIAIVFYDREGTLIVGSVPSELADLTTFQDQSLYTLKKNKSYDIYDQAYYYGTQMLWVRGIADHTSIQNDLSDSVWMFLFLVPVLVLIAVILAAIFIRKTFAHVGALTDSAEQIATHTHLSSRLPLPEHHDEFYDLTSALNAMLDQLETALKREEEFSENIAHEIKTPLSAIMLECENALRQDPLSAEYQESFRRIQTQVTSLMRLVNELMQLSRSLSADQVLEMDDVDCFELFDAIIDQYRDMYPDMIFEADLQEGVVMKGDETMLMRMIMNLLDNSITYRDFTRIPHIILKMSCDSKIRIDVADNGMGIAQDNLPHIFERFYKVDAARHRKDSYGLGLAMVKWIVEAHKGQISVESTLGEGTTFHIVF